MLPEAEGWGTIETGIVVCASFLLRVADVVSSGVLVLSSRFECVSRVSECTMVIVLYFIRAAICCAVPEGQFNHYWFAVPTECKH